MHDFKEFPELPNSQMDLYYWQSPHKQIFEDFDCEVVKVHDGDSITVRWNERDFDFPVRISNISARELKETEDRDTSGQLSADGRTAKAWLESRILGENITVKINPKNRVEKFGRLLGEIIFRGLNIGEEEIIAGMAVAWENRNDGIIIKLKKILGEEKWH